MDDLLKIMLIPVFYTYIFDIMEQKSLIQAMIEIQDSLVSRLCASYSWLPECFISRAPIHNISWVKVLLKTKYISKF